MSEATNPLEEAVERAVEAFVYAPIGLVFDGPADYPKLVEQGRNQVTMARMMGEFAVQAGQGEALKALDAGRSQLFEALGNLGLPGLGAPKRTDERGPSATDEAAVKRAATTPAAPPAPKTAAKKPSAKKAASKKTRAKKTTTKKATKKTSSAKKKTASKKAPAKRSELGIPDYDSLSASQVVTRLAGLSKADLEAARVHESANRGRKTILNKIAQLQA